MRNDLKEKNGSEKPKAISKPEVNLCRKQK
jgi:hypothetical protein